MQKRTKKELILDAALTLFSEKGYDGVGVDLIAEKVGMKGPSLYNHFKGKEAILNALIDKFEEYYKNNIEEINKDKKIPKNIDELVDLSIKQIEFTLHDSQIIKVRKLLAMEQFRDSRIAEVATAHYITGMETRYKKIFLEMMKAGILREDDPEVLALQYVAPVTLLIHVCDREPDKEYECMQKIKRHIKHFASVYALKK